MDKKYITYIEAFFVVILWSFNFVIARYVMFEMEPLAIAFWRWAFAAIIFVPWVIVLFYKNLKLIISQLGLVLD